MKINITDIEVLTKKKYLEYIKLFPVLKEEKTKRYGMAILTLTTITFFGIFAINPTLTTITELHRKLADVKLVDKSLKTKIENLKTLQNKYALLQADTDRISASIPESPAVPRFLGQMQAIAKQSNVQLSSLTTDSYVLTSPGGVAANVIGFTASITGTYDNIMTFLTTVTGFERITTLEVLGISKSSIQSKDIQVSIQGSIHSLP